MSFTASALVLTWVALLLLSLVVAGLVRQVHHLQRSRSASPDRQLPRGRIGAALPAVADLDMTTTRVLLLLDADCDACATLLDTIGATLSPTVIRDDIAVLYADRIDPQAQRLGPRVVGGAGELFDEVGATVLPYGVALDTDGRVAAAGPVGAVSQLMPLLTTAGVDHAAQTHDIHPEVSR